MLLVTGTWHTCVRQKGRGEQTKRSRRTDKNGEAKRQKGQRRTDKNGEAKRQKGQRRTDKNSQLTEVSFNFVTIHVNACDNDWIFL